MGTGEFINNVLFVKCFGCFKLLEAHPINFTTQKGKLKTKCNKCMKKVYVKYYSNKKLKGG